MGSVLVKLKNTVVLISGPVGDTVEHKWHLVESIRKLSRGTRYCAWIQYLHEQNDRLTAHKLKAAVSGSKW